MRLNIGLIVIALFVFSCSKEKLPEDVIEENKRTFYMGFTAFPYDYSVEAEQVTFENVILNGDVFLAHLDHGVPWEEALHGLPFPDEIQRTLNLTAILPGSVKILLTATPTSQTRKDLAKYWNNNGSHQPLPAFWQNKTFDDPDVIEAYTNYCRRIINQVQPDYFAYGIETNATFKKEEDSFKGFLVLAEKIYTKLKADYPNLPIFLTIQDQSFENSRSELLDISTMLIQYSDYIAMSTYPYLHYENIERDANPNLFSDNWLGDFRTLDPSKPFAIAETGFCAENLVIDNLGINIKGTAAWQAAYLTKLFNHANEFNAEFIAWFIYQDYDKLYDNTPNPPDIFKVWKDTGLIDGNGHKRPSYTIWKTWMSYKK